MKLDRLATRLAAIVFSLFFLMAAVATFSLVLAVDGIVGKMGRSFAAERAETVRAKIAGYVQRETTLALKLADSPALKRWMLAESDPKLKAEAFEELGSFRKAFRDENFFVAVDSSKTYYNQPPQDPLSTSVLRQETPGDAWYFDFMARGADYSLNLDYNDLIRQTKVWINCLVRSGDRAIGVAGSGIELTTIIADLLRSEGSGIKSMLVDGEGAITAHPDMAYLESNAQNRNAGGKITVFDLADSTKDRALLVRMLDEARAGRDAIDLVGLEGRDALTAIDPLPDIGWFAVVSVDASGSVKFGDFLPLFILFPALVLAALFAVAFYMDRAVLRPISAMTASARRIADGDYDLVMPAGRNDEIGRLAKAFDEMTSKVREYTRGLESLVRERTAELSETNKKLASANERMTESIRYASLVQDGFLKKSNELPKRIERYSLFLRQRDVVGGDFLYFSDAGEGYLIAAVDCAGHGVSGALMAMMVNSALDLIVAGRTPEDPAGILRELDETVRASLERGGGEGRIWPGLDIGLCACFPARETLVFAGAGMPLYERSAGGAMETIPGRPRAIGRPPGKRPVPFNNVVRATGGKTFFMVTDGFVDQTGGDGGKSYGTKRLLALLAAVDGEGGICDPDWEGVFDSYRGERTQLDDVLAFGFGG